MEKEENDVLFKYLGKKKEISVKVCNTIRGNFERSKILPVVHGELLFHITNEKRLQRVVTGEEEQNRIIRTLHTNIAGCNFGQNAAIKKATEWYWWKLISKDMREFVGSYPECQRANPNNKS